MKRVLLIAASALLITSEVQATTFLVGPSRTYTSPSKVMGLVHDGDTVLIDAVLYSGDVGTWTKSNLVIKGVGGLAHLDAAGKNAGSKAIWVVQGANTYIENIEFSGAAVPDLNGAGIRQEGAGLELRHCYFHDNEDGVLAGDNANSDILFEACEFDHNGHGDGYSHNMYINHVRSFTLRFCYIHRANVGHEVKSRAYTTYVFYNRITDEADGTASYCIDLPNGGDAYIVGNSIQKGPNAQNRQIVRFGEEGQTNPLQRIYIVNNTMVSELQKCTFISLAGATTLAKLYNNLFAGPGTLYDMNISGSIDSARNILAGPSNGFGTTWHFSGDSVHYDYHATGEDFALGAADPGSANGIALRPSAEYVHPTDSTTRADNGFTIGAFSWHVSSVGTAPDPSAALRVFPNPTSGLTTLTFDKGAENSRVVLWVFDLLGREVLHRSSEMAFSSATFDLSVLRPGHYTLSLTRPNGALIGTSKLIVR